MEVPEIYDGTVEIKSVSREAGDRSKIAVYTSQENIDPIGACVGPKGARVRNVVNELNGEMVDIIEWSEDPVVYISHALSPSDVVHVEIHEDDHSALVIVPDNQLSLAIGKRGQNARLAVRLTGWKIDIKSVSEAASEGIVYGTDAEFEKSFEAEMTKQDDVVEQDNVEEEIFEEETFENEVEQEVPDLQEDDMVEDDSLDEETFDDYDDYDDDYEDYDYDPKYDEDIDYDEFDKYYDEK